MTGEPTIKLSTVDEPTVAVAVIADPDATENLAGLRDAAAATVILPTVDDPGTPRAEPTDDEYDHTDDGPENDSPGDPAGTWDGLGTGLAYVVTTVDGRPIRFFADAARAEAVADFLATPPSQGALVFAVHGRLVHDTRYQPPIAADTDRHLAGAAAFHDPLPEPDAA